MSVTQVVWMFLCLHICRISTRVDAQIANTYTEKEVHIPIDAIVKTISSASSLQCVLKCRRSNTCKQAAMQLNGNSPPVCLHLKGVSFGNSTCDGDDCSGVRVTLMEEFKPNITLPQNKEPLLFPQSKWN